MIGVELIIVAVFALLLNLILSAVVIYVLRDAKALRKEFSEKEKQLLDRIMTKDYAEYSLIRRADEAAAGPRERPEDTEERGRYDAAHGLT